MDFNPSSFVAHWDDAGNLVVDISGADPDGIQTVKWRYVPTDGSRGTSGSINGPYAHDDGTATITVGHSHFPGDPDSYLVTASQTLGPEGPVAAAPVA